MRALTLWQPHAGLIATGIKTIETRTWPTPHRGRLAIHAGKQYAHGYLERAYEAGVLQPIQEPPFRHLVYRMCNLQGAVLCLVDLMDCRPMNPGDEQAAKASWHPRLWAWVLANPYIIPDPPKARGMQGLWELPEDVLRRVLPMGEVDGYQPLG